MPLARAAALLGALAAGPAAAGEVIVIVSHDSGPYEQAVSGIRQALGQEASLRVFELHGDRGLGRAVAAEAAETQGAVVIALGALAIEAAAARTDLPVVAAMALREQDVPHAPNVTGVFLEFPPALQIAWLRKTLPSVRSVAVVYSPKENSRAVDLARRAAEREGLRFEAVPAPEPQDIPRALEKVASSADALLGLTDSVVYTPQTAKGILLFSFRNRVPLVGVPASWVQAGALFGLDRDYADVGRQAGEAALRILRGTAPSAIAAIGPRKPCFVANRRTAEHMKIEIPGVLLHDACAVY